MEIIVIKTQGNEESFTPGDVWKVQPKNWHKYFIIPTNMAVIKVISGDFRDIKRKLTTCGATSRRRYQLDLTKLGGRKTVFKIDKYILDKEI